MAYAPSAGDGSGRVDLWVLDVTRGARTRVTLDGDNRFYPLWTPDGKRSRTQPLPDLVSEAPARIAYT